MSQTLKFSDGDLVLGENGQGQWIWAEEKLSQDVAEALLMKYNAEDDMGNRILSVEIPSASNHVLMEGWIKSEVSQAISRYRVVAQGFPYRQEGETIRSVRRLDVVMSGNLALFYLEIETENGTTVPQTFKADLGHIVPPDSDVNTIIRSLVGEINA